MWKQKSELIAAGLTASQIQLAARLANEFGGALGFESLLTSIVSTKIATIKSRPHVTPC